jgi:hypothetical protein
MDYSMAELCVSIYLEINTVSDRCMLLVFPAATSQPLWPALDQCVRGCQFRLFACVSLFAARELCHLHFLYLQLPGTNLYI